MNSDINDEKSKFELLFNLKFLRKYLEIILFIIKTDSKIIEHS